jgi:A/G-specific adenine glycosylase
MRTPAVPPAARTAILAWYDARGRRLPFRGLTDPYAILVSEVMAQQTQIARVGPAWSAFMDRFPTAGALAAAQTADVLRAWRGLGYNRRAVNLQRAARAIVVEHGGRVPADVDALERLPGIGPYTARAVAALAHGRAVGPVDTNVRRVLTRLTDSEHVPPRELQAVADAAVPPERPADWTHALMDLGATICRPTPSCDECPVRTWCRSPGRPSRRRRAPAREQAFTTTTRWLRGRMLDRLRDAPGGEWASFEGSIGHHDEEAVRTALRAMELDGLVELHPADPARGRLPAG